MKRIFIFIITTCLLFCGLTVTSYASIVTIGTATYDGLDYNLIYDADAPLGPITWLDYTNHTIGSWANMNDWAASLNNTGVITYSLNPGVSTNWSGDWRLPSAPDGLMGGPVNGSEMGHLYYAELGNTPPGPFQNLASVYYWSDMNSEPHFPGGAWFFNMQHGYRAAWPTGTNLRGIAVRPGAVVPIPGAVWLLGSGLIGLGVIRKKVKK